jgi:hypothetical protein
MNTRQQIDQHLKAIASLNANIGIDSTSKEKAEINAQINEHLKAIKEIDAEFYNEIVPDKKDKN